MHLLIDITSMGVPCDYLYARIRCRRLTLNDAELLQRAEAGGPQQALRAEYRWVYRQLEQRLRRALLPLFEYFELRLLVVILRYLAVADRSALDDLLRHSLLQLKLRNILRASGRVATTISRLEKLLAEDYPIFQGLTETYLRQGPGGLEQALIGGYLQNSINRSSSRQVREFLIYLLDMRNLQALYKHLHWQVSPAPPLLTGGALNLRICKKIWTEQDLNALLSLMQKFSQQTGHPEDAGVEDFLFQGLSASLKRAGRDPLQIGLIIDYLWRCRLAARNHGLQIFGGSTETEGYTAEPTG